MLLEYYNACFGIKISKLNVVRLTACFDLCWRFHFHLFRNVEFLRNTVTQWIFTIERFSIDHRFRKDENDEYKKEKERENRSRALLDVDEG